MSDLPLNQILCGNCVEVLKDFPDNSIDLVVTDPPYGLSFMGKDWDKAIPPREAFEGIIRVLKPGALAFVMSSPRQDVLWRMLALLEGVGFELTQSYIDWIYKTGFPKAYDVSKGIDKKIGQINHSTIEIKKKLKTIYKKSGKSLKQINQECGFEASGYIRMKGICPWIHTLPTYEKWLKIKEVIKYLPNDLDELFKEAERKTIGKKPYSSDKHMPLPTLYDGQRIQLYETRSIHNESKKWDGWKSQTGLKPAHEPILMVNKPFSESTIVDNVLKWGTGAINVDACRIPINEDIDDSRLGGKGEWNTIEPQTIYGGGKGIPRGRVGSSSLGRFPANLLVSDKAIDTGKKTGRNKIYPPRNVVNPQGVTFMTDKPTGQEYDDIGDQSRYFDLDAWAEHHGFLDVPKPDNKERDFGLKGKKNVPKSKFNLNDGSKDMRFDGVVPTPRRNVHPTVKPIKLMAYLIELGCPPDGVVLDPFVGSGTTCIAAKKLHRRYIGIEINPEYHRMAEARISAYPVPLSWFSGSETEDVLVPPRGCKE